MKSITTRKSTEMKCNLFHRVWGNSFAAMLLFEELVPEIKSNFAMKAVHPVTFFTVHGDLPKQCWAAHCVDTDVSVSRSWSWNRARKPSIQHGSLRKAERHRWNRSLSRRCSQWVVEYVLRSCFSKRIPSTTNFTLQYIFARYRRFSSFFNPFFRFRGGTSVVSETTQRLQVAPEPPPTCAQPHATGNAFQGDLFLLQNACLTLPASAVFSLRIAIERNVAW